jgi:hypothetical protein
MLFSSYNYPPPPKQNNTLWVVLGVCCGSSLLIVGLIIGGIYFAVHKVADTFQNMAASYEAADRNSQLFLTYLRDHKFAEARGLMSLSGQNAWPEKDLKESVVALEKKFGPLQSWKKDTDTESQFDGDSSYRSSSRDNGSNSGTPSADSEGNTSRPPGARTRRHVFNGTVYRLKYAKGTALADIGYEMTDQLRFSNKIEKFDLSEPDETSKDSAEDPGAKNMQDHTTKKK